MSLPSLIWTSTDEVAIAALGARLKNVVGEGRRGGVVWRLLEGEGESQRRLLAELGDDGLDTLIETGLATAVNGWVKPNFQAKMVGEHLVFSDIKRSMRRVRAEKDADLYVDPMWEGPAIANLLVRRRVGRGLDMGCGCGIIALTMSTYCAEVVALDVNPRALMLTRFNVALNGIDNVTVHASDLFSAVPEMRFDRIVFNTPVGMELVPHNALESGEQILRRFFASLDAHLRPRGLVQMNLCVKDFSRASFASNLRDWLGGSADEFGALFLEQWRVDSGAKFLVRRWLAPFVLPHHYGRLLHIRRGLLFLSRDGRPRHVEVATRYDRWAAELGAEFGDRLVSWAMLEEPGAAELPSRLPAWPRGDLGAVARGVVYEFDRALHA